MTTNNSKIVDYLVIQILGENKFTQRINTLLDEGYQPLGNLYIDEEENGDNFIQLMVRYEKSKIVDYQTCSEETRAKLDKEVNDYIKNGYEPSGPAQIVNLGRGMMQYYQTMIKYSR